jgi:hypothetical protein
VPILRRDHKGQVVAFPDGTKESEIEQALEDRYIDSMADVSPIDIKPIVHDPGPVARGKNPPFVANKDEQEFGKKGYRWPKMGDPLTLSDRLKTALAAGPGYLEQFISRELRRTLDPDRTHFGAMSDIAFLRNEDGKYFYLNAKTPANPRGDNRWVYLQTLPGTVAREGTAMTGETAGYLAGHKTGRHLMDTLDDGLTARGNFPAARTAAAWGERAIPKIGGAFGTAAAAAGLEAARLTAGKALGVNEGLTKQEILEETGDKALWAGATTLVGDAVLSKFPQFGKGAKHSYFFDPEAADDIERGFGGARPVVNEIRRLQEQFDVQPGTTFNPTAGQQTGVQNLLDAEATLLAKQGNSSSLKITAEMRKQQSANERIVSDIVGTILTPTEQVDRLVTGQGAHAAAERGAAAQAVTDADRRMAELKTQMGNEGFEPPDAEGVVAAARGAKAPPDDIAGSTGLLGVIEEQTARESEAWNRVAQYESTPEAMGDDIADTFTIRDLVNHELDIPLDAAPFMRAMEWIKKTSLFDKDAAGRTKFLEPIIRAVMRQPGQGRGVMYGGEAGSISLAAMNQAIKYLHAVRRGVTNPGELADSDKAMLNFVITSLERQRAATLSVKNPEALDAILAAERTTQEKHDLLERTVYKIIGANPAGLTMAADGQVYQTSAETIMRTVMNDRTGYSAKLFNDLVQYDPAARQKFIDYIWDNYRQFAYRRGIVDPARHNAWMGTYGRIVDSILTSPMDKARLSRLDGFASAYERITRDNVVALGRWRHSWEKKVGAMQPENIYNKTVKSDTFGTGEFEQMWSSMDNGVKEGLRNVTRDELRVQMMKDGKLRATEFLRGLFERQDTAYIRKLRTMFGHQYVQDLENAYRATVMLGRKGNAINIPAQTPALTVLRVVFGPLSKAQRAITAGKQYQIVGYEKAMRDLLSDPEKLRIAMANANASISAMDHRWPGVLSAIGFEFLHSPELKTPYEQATNGTR